MRTSCCEVSGSHTKPRRIQPVSHTQSFQTREQKATWWLPGPGECLIGTEFLSFFPLLSFVCLFVAWAAVLLLKQGLTL